MPGVLTKKQSWRRQGISSRRRQHDLIYQEGFANKTGAGPRSFSDQSFREGPPLLHQGSKPWGTTGNLQDHKHDLFGNKLKSVMFSARVNIILIPSIAEYEAAGLANQLWWVDEDYKGFKQSALREVKDYMSLKSIQDSKDAIRQLYQNMENNDLEKITVKDVSEKEPDSEKEQCVPVAAVSPSLIQSEKVSRPFIAAVREAGKGFKLFLRRSQSFCGTSSQPEREKGQDCPFRSKTDLDIIHEKETTGMVAYEEFLARLKKLHHERAASKASAVCAEEKQIHPLALICS